MEKSVETNFNDYMKNIFAMQEVDIREYSPLTLAYIGDSIYDLIIKSLVINRGNKQVQKLHKRNEQSRTGFGSINDDESNAGGTDGRRKGSL